MKKESVDGFVVELFLEGMEKGCGDRKIDGVVGGCGNIME